MGDPGLQKKFFRPLGPQFGLNIRGAAAPRPYPGSATESHPIRLRLTGEKKTWTNDISEVCSYIDGDSRWQNKRQRMLKGKSRLCQLLSHFTTYLPNVSYVNSKRPRKEGCSNEGKKTVRQKAGGKGGGNWRRWRWEKRKDSEWKGEKGDESNFGMWNSGFSRLRGKHYSLLLSVSTIIISLLLHLEQKRMYLFGTTLRVECPHDIIQGRHYLVCFCPVIISWISLCCYSTNKVNRSQIDLQEIIIVIVCGRNPAIGSF